MKRFVDEIIVSDSDLDVMKRTLRRYLLDLCY